jgi:hypothetical protein
VRVSFVLLLTPFIIACGRLPGCNPDHPIPLVYLQIQPTNWKRRGFRKGTVLRSTQGRIQITTLGMKHEVKMRTLRGKLKSANVIEEHYGNVKDEWAIIGTADETHTKACGGVNGQMARKFMADGYSYTWDA